MAQIIRELLRRLETAYYTRYAGCRPIGTPNRWWSTVI